MAFVVPNFNLTCDIFKNEGTLDAPVVPSLPARLAAVPCALVYGRRVNVASTGGTSSPGVPLECMSLLVPKLTDIRGPQDVVINDVVAVPAGSGRWYGVNAVDDIGKGYPNEHRSATIFALPFSWTPPYP
jgi:hypothetical protein